MAPSSILLDSHIVLWLLNQDPLSAQTKGLLTQALQLYCSAASVWELSIKAQSGKLELPSDWLKAVITSGIQLLDVTCEHALAIQGVEVPHGDPFDRLLVAQAMAERLALLTADAMLWQAHYSFIIRAKQ